MKQKREHINEEDFQRYLDDKMTPAERNLFERELQKDHFKAEAIEGFEGISPVNIQNDLKELKGKVTYKKRRNKYHYWATAASILLVVTAGIIWMDLKDQNSVQEMAESKTVEKRDIIPEKSATVTTPVLNEKEQVEESKLKVQDNISKESKKPEKFATTEMEKKKSDQNILIALDEAEFDEEVSENYNLPLARVKSKESNKTSNSNRNLNNAASKTYIDGVEAIPLANQAQIDEYRSFSGKIVSSVDSLPLPGVSIVEKGTQNGVVSDIDGNFELQILNDSNPEVIASFVGMETYEFIPETDSDNVILLEPAQIAMDEVVVVAYGTERKKSLTGSVAKVSKASKKSKPEPVCGMEEYNDYLKENTILPNDHPRKKVVVKLILHLDHDGVIISVENKNSADSLVFEKAKQIINDGPEWAPEIKAGVPVDSEIEIKIVFRKEN